MKVIKINKILFYSACIILTVIVLLILSVWKFPLLWLTIFHDCTEQLSSKISNGDNYFVEEIIANCGATSDYSTRYKINNLTTGNTEIILSLKGDQTKSCDFEWKESNTLVVSCLDAKNFVYTHEYRFEDIKIEYILNGVIQ